MSEQSTAIPPHVQLIQIGIGCWMSRLVSTAANLRIADHLANSSKSAEAMVGIHGAEPSAVAAAYDFSRLGVIVDVGGATGNMLAHILARYPGSQGVLFDRAHVVAEAPALLRAKGVESRVRIEHGSFFESVPGGGDAYILSHIIHDWKEDQCLTILGNCR